MRDRAKRTVPRRRRRTWYRRRLRIQRTLASTALMALIAFLCWENASRFFPLPAVHSSQLLSDSFWKRTNLRQDLAWTPPHVSKRMKYIERIPNVYPYSIVPGGLKDGESLREVARNDRAVSRHFAHFDYSKAHLETVTEPREVYVSYRIRDTVFWTRKKIHLRVGELLLTDGKITARAKCGNQVSETPKPEISEEEPEENVLEEPVALEPLGPSVPLRAALDPPELPSGVPIAPRLYANGFAFPYVPLGATASVPAPVHNHLCKFEDGDVDKHCHHLHHRPPVVPEPSTMILIASGLAVVGCRFRTSGRPLSA